MKLWLDDIRDPAKFGRPDWIWVKTADEAIEMLKTGIVTVASLDHDLTEDQMVRGGYYGEIYEDGLKSGYDVVVWLEQHPDFWPPVYVHVHSANPVGRARMLQVIDRHYEIPGPAIGQKLRRLLLESGLTKQEVNDVVKEIFARSYMKAELIDD